MSGTGSFPPPPFSSIANCIKNRIAVSGSLLFDNCPFAWEHQGDQVLRLLHSSRLPRIWSIGHWIEFDRSRMEERVVQVIFGVHSKRGLRAPVYQVRRHQEAGGILR